MRIALHSLLPSHPALDTSSLAPDRLARALRALGHTITPVHTTAPVQTMSSSQPEGVSGRAAALEDLSEPDVWMSFGAEALDRVAGAARSGPWLHFAEAGDGGEGLRRADACIYTSHAAARAAQRESGVHPDRSLVLPACANFESAGEPALAAPPRKDPLAVTLFLADPASGANELGFAREVCSELRAIGARPRLLHHGVVDLGEKVQPPGETPLGDVPAGPDGAELRRRAHQISHFALLAPGTAPRAALCAEASSFGVPGIAAQHEALDATLAPGTNGILVPADAEAREFAAAIRESLLDRERYLDLRRSCRRHFRAVLSWAAVAREITSLLFRLRTRVPEMEPGRQRGAHA